MKGKKLYLALLLLLCTRAFSQSPEGLPVMTAPHADTTKPLIVYISGDGGFNAFSRSLVNSFQSAGYGVVALNAKEYFWKKKTPEKTAADLSALIARYLKEWKRRDFILMGYSFGADVAPFVAARLPPALAAKAAQVVLIAPAETTTFEIKVADMLGWGKKGGDNVVAEINKLQKPVLLVMAKDDKDFPLQQVTLPHKQVLLLPGGHRFEGDAAALSQQIRARLASGH